MAREVRSPDLAALPRQQLMAAIHVRMADVCLIGLIWLAAALRLHSLFTNTFHADEALFASWARLIAVWRDPLLATQLVDKPPLLFYLQAPFFPLLGSGAPWVARLPNLIASLLIVPLVHHLVWRIYGDRLAAILAATFVALSPLAVQFSATAFTDPLLSFFILLTLVVLTHDKGRERNGGARNGLYVGLLFGLAVAAKHQAWLFLPLLAGMALLRGWSKRVWFAWLAGMLLMIVMLFAWEVARTGHFSLWSIQFEHYGGLRMARSWEVWARLGSWGQLWNILIGSPVLGFFLVLTLPIFLALLISEQDWSTAYDQLCVIFVAAYALLHWFVAVPIWDRYLLALVPLLGLLMGRFVSRVLTFIEPAIPLPRLQLAFGTVLMLFLLLLPGGAAARQAAYPVGGQPGASPDVTHIATALKGEPYGTVLYDHWFSWHWRYHMFDSKVYVSWFAHPASLIRDLQAFGERGTRYLVLPQGEVAQAVRRAVLDTGFSLRPVFQGEAMTLYRIEHGE